VGTPTEPEPPVSAGLFSGPGIWSTPLKADVPIDPHSPQLVARLLSQIESEQRGGGGPSLGLWGRTSVYEVGPDQPRVPVYLDTGPWGDSLAVRLRAGVPVPAGARPVIGQDHSMAIWQPSTDSYWEFFHMEQQLHAPQFSRSATVSAGCQLPAGNYFYKLTSLNSAGETTAGTPPLKVRVPAAGGCIKIYWSAISGAAGYRIYRGVSESQLRRLAAVGGTRTNFEDDGTLVPEDTAPPAANTAATPGEWHATYGGFVPSVSTSPGYYHDVSDGSGKLIEQWGWGAAATGMPLAGGLITKRDVERGRIDHALSLGLVNSPASSIIRAGAFAFPAQRSDGKSTAPDSIPEGARFMLDPALDLDALHLSRLTRMLADAAQRYGIVVHDGSLGTVIYAEDPSPYVGRGEANFYSPLIGSNSTRAMQDFPWSALRVAQMHLCTRGPCFAS
jgi:hypothetical protein